MSVIKGKNYSWTTQKEFTPQPGDEFVMCNFTQKYPHTAITEITGLIFRDCGLINCIVAKDSEIIDCNTKQISRCGNLNEDYDCEPNCSHVTSFDELEIDGVVVETIYQYADTRV